jgi:hypothetical protein
MISLKAVLRDGERGLIEASIAGTAAFRGFLIDTAIESGRSGNFNRTRE